MTLHNTSRYPTDEVQRLVAFAGIPQDVTVRVTNSRRWPGHGRAWDYGRIVLHIGPPELFPAYDYAVSGNCIPLRDWRESLVRIAAHEARHLWQWAKGKPINDDDCELFAGNVLARYRAFR